jgi:magnesium-transporting ATPase (P-type)
MRSRKWLQYVSMSEYDYRESSKETYSKKQIFRLRFKKSKMYRIYSLVFLVLLITICSYYLLVSFCFQLYYIAILIVAMVNIYSSFSRCYPRYST